MAIRLELEKLLDGSHVGLEGGDRPPFDEAADSVVKGAFGKDLGSRIEGYMSIYGNNAFGKDLLLHPGKGGVVKGRGL